MEKFVKRWVLAHLLGDANILSSIKANGSVDLNNVNGNVKYYFDDSRPLNSPGGVGYGMFEQQQKGRLRYQIWLDWSTSEPIIYHRYIWNTEGAWTPPNGWRKVTDIPV